MTLHHGDCIEVMAGMDPESVDAICTDPPYAFPGGFMSKAWDRFTGEDVDPAFLHWFAGFTDGEGCFSIHRKPQDTYDCQFSITLRADDRPILERIHRTLGMGSLSKPEAHRTGDDNPKARWSVSSKGDCLRLRDIFRSFPLRAKKATDFEEWSIALDEWVSHERGEWEGMAESRERLMSSRAYKPEGVRVDPYQLWTIRWARQALRVLKPGGWLIAAGAPKRVHRMTSGLEDAGFEIRDMVLHCFASGFPKGRANLKPAYEPWVLARKPGPLRMLAIDSCRIPSPDADLDAVQRQTDPSTFQGKGGNVQPMYSPAGRWPANVILTDPIFDGGVEGVVGGGESASGGNINGRPVTGYSKGWADERWFDGYSDTGTYSRYFLIPKADRADREPVLGGLPERAIVRERLNVGITERGEHEEFVHRVPAETGPWLKRERERAGLTRSDVVPYIVGYANRETVLARLSDWERGAQRPSPDNWRRLRALIGFDDRYDEVMTATQMVENHLSGEQPKLGRQNVHPTVKPTDLMRHLVRLVTPTGGVVLDPFLGSGTTALAAEMEGFEWIGIEREAEYVAIAEARLNGTQRGLGLGLA